MESPNDSKRRFSGRVENYARYRPGYPDELVRYLTEKGIGSGSIVCDIGAGTGLLSRILIDIAGRVIAVEPNRDMLDAADRSLSAFGNYKSLPGSGENTLMEDGSVDAITVAQAFHWFDREKCKKEFKRILKPGGTVFLIRNNRIKNTPFLKEYDDLLYRFGTDYRTVNHQNLTDEIFEDFCGRNYEKKEFENFQEFGLEGFLGRVFSSSYTPSPGHPDYQAFLKELHRLFAEHQENATVRFNYRTEVYYGNM